MEREATPIRRIHVSEQGRFGVARIDAAEQGLEALGLRAAEPRHGRRALAGPADGAGRPGHSHRRGSLGSELAGERARAAPRARRHRREIARAAGGRGRRRAIAGPRAGRASRPTTGRTRRPRSSPPSPRSASTITWRTSVSPPTGRSPCCRSATGVAGSSGRGRPRTLHACSRCRTQSSSPSCRRPSASGSGACSRVGVRQPYELALSRAERHVGERLAIVGNAAQALHPIAGQGFNLGLRDAASLAEVLADARAEGDARRR